ncbi:unnamed protein product [Rotaria sp. Silwood2]|nr:unnamed protein product [Rotaria sp. Silwood2]
MDHDYFLATLNEFIQKTKEIIEKLNIELEWINGHHDRCRVAKTAGTTLSVTGAVVTGGALLLAPFTGNRVYKKCGAIKFTMFTEFIGGASLVAAAGYGAAVGLTGAGINLTTDITDIFASRIVSNGIEKICAERNQVAHRLQECLQKLEDQAKEFMEYDVDEDTAYALAAKGYTIYSVSKGALTLTRCAQAAKDSFNLTLRNGGKFWRGLRIQSEGLMKTLAYFGVNVSKKGAMLIVRSGTMLLSGIFAIYDVRSLIKTLENNHPTADGISKIIECMKEEMDQISKLRDESME